MTTKTPWRIAELGSLVDVLDARRIPVSASERSSRIGSVPYYGATGRVGSIDVHLFDEPLVLLGEDGVQFFDPFKTKSYLIDGPAWVNNHAHVLRAKDDIDRRYLVHFLNQFDYHGYANGTTRLKLTQAAMRRIPVVVPPLDEQRRIVEVLESHLSRLDAASEYSLAASRKLRTFRALQLKSLIDGPAVKLGELALDSGYGTSTKCDVAGHGTPVARIPNLVLGAIDMTDEKRAIDRRVDLSGLLLKQGDVLIVRTNGSRQLIGRSAVVEHDMDAAFASYLIRFQFDPRRVLPQWIHLALESPTARAALEGLAGSSAGQYNLGLKKLKGLSIPCPSLEVQRAALESFAESSDVESRLSSALDATQVRARTLYRSLLIAAFTGELTNNAAKELTAA